MNPFHATAAERIHQTELRLGRKVWAARELPDPLSQALWWKQRRWYFDARRQSLAYDDPAIYGADDEYHEAEAKHALLIREMWLRRRMALEDRAWEALASIGTALAPERTEDIRALFSDAATEAALGRL